MKKVIAIDINDTLRDNIRQFIKYYTKEEDEFCDISYEDVNTIEFDEIFQFKSKEDYDTFRYVDFAYELFGRAELMDETVSRNLNVWLQNYLTDMDEDDIPHVMFVSPYEYALTIQATYAFLAKIGTRVREVVFPIDSSTIWDRCDILITANPKLIANKPEDKVAIKIKTPYNETCECDYEFGSLNELFSDENHTIKKLLNKD